MRRLESLSFYLSATECLVDGEGSGLVSSERLSLGGSVDSGRGEEIDRHHPLGGESIAGRALVISQGQNSWASGAGLLEAIHARQAPALIVLNRADDIIVLEAIVAEEVLSLAVPIVVLDDARFALAQSAHLVTLHRGRQLVLSGPRLAGLANVTAGGELGHEPAPADAANDGFALSLQDQRCLAGDAGRAVQAAMRIMMRLARLQGASELLDVTRVAIDGGLSGPAGLAVGEHLADWGGKVSVPTTVVATFDTTIDTTLDKTFVTTAVSTETSETAERLIELCRRLDASPVTLAEPVPACAPLPWLLGLCVALTGRAPALSAC